MLVQDHLDGQLGEGELGEAQPRLRVRDHRPVTGRGRDEHDQPVDRQLLERRPRERDVPELRRVEGAAENPGY
jgi:hypothetical protein